MSFMDKEFVIDIEEFFKYRVPGVIDGMKDTERDNSSVGDVLHFYTRIYSVMYRALTGYGSSLIKHHHRHQHHHQHYKVKKCVFRIFA